MRIVAGGWLLVLIVLLELGPNAAPGLARQAGTPPLPPPSVPPVQRAEPAPDGGGESVTVSVDRLAEIEDRLRALEEQNQRLADENRELRQRFDGGTPPIPSPNVGGSPGAASRGLGEVMPPVGPYGGTSFEAVPDSPIPSYSGVTEARESDDLDIQGKFGRGFEFESNDGEYLLQVHMESQTDYRAFDPNGELYARDGIYAPRNRILFGGRATRSVEYLFSINKGFSDLFLLDAYVNFRRNDALQLKVGRFMTPFNYEQFAIQNMWLIAPERSLLTTNLGLNRQFGSHLWGSVLEDRLDYALGVFSGPRNSFEDYNDSLDVVGYMNARPFQNEEEGSLLRFLNFGGSFTYGSEDNPLLPRSFRLATNASNAGQADRASPPFLVFDNAVIERGQRSFWSAHVAYFYKSLSVVADYNGGITRYAATPAAPTSVVVPITGTSVAAGYFLTGEELEQRTIVEPLRPFNIRPGEFAPGAIELIARYSTLDLNRSVFEGGLADPELWSNRAWVTNLGINWYPNRFVKVYVDWQHGEFGDPVFYAEPNKKSLTNDMFWLRCQFYF